MYQFEAEAENETKGAKKRGHFKNLRNVLDKEKYQPESFTFRCYYHGVSFSLNVRTEWKEEKKTERGGKQAQMVMGHIWLHIMRIWLAARPTEVLPGFLSFPPFPLPISSHYSFRSPSSSPCLPRLPLPDLDLLPEKSIRAQWVSAGWA